MLSHEQYAHFLTVAQRHARKRDDAEDLLHESLLAAVRAGRGDLADSSNRAWLAGVIANQAAMQARGAGRRKARESAVAARDPQNQTAVDESAAANDELDLWLERLARLPRASRHIATLALHGMTRAEMAFALQISDATLRQRLTALRRALADAGLLEPSDTLENPATWSGPRSVRRNIGSQLHLGVLRKALLNAVQRHPGVGTHDPDGHLLVIARNTNVKSTSQLRRARQR